MRTIDQVPEGGCHISDIEKYCVKDDPEPNKQLGVGVTREWVVTYRNPLGDPWTLRSQFSNETFIVHALTKEGAFDHFISIKPNAKVLAVKFYGIYF